MGLLPSALSTGAAGGGPEGTPNAHNERMKEMCEPPLRVSGLVDVLAVVPYLIGFSPQESVVAIVMVRGVVKVSARWDIPRDEAEWKSLHDRLGALRRQFEGSALGMIVYSADGARARYLLAWLGLASARGMLFGIACDGDLWWESDALDEPGSPVPGDATAIAATAVHRGLSALPTRDHLAAAFAPLSVDRADIVAPERDRLRRSVRRRSLALRFAELDEFTRCGPAAPEDAFARAGIIVGTDRPWVHAWQSLTLDAADERQRLWHGVLSRSLPVDAAPVFALLGIASWLTGDGASAVICLDKGRRLQAKAIPGLSILEFVVDSALPPEKCAELPFVTPHNEPEWIGRAAG